MSSLNVGCGRDLWGEVRLDIIRTPTTTIVGDAQHLPFKDKSFCITKASHVLEHLENPIDALNELIRVTTNKMIIKFPTRADWKPVALMELLSLNVKYFIFTFRPRLHKWIINPKIVAWLLEKSGYKTRIYEGTLCVFGFFEGGRKAKYFRWLTRHFRLPFEYVIEAEKVVG
jgi:ubiquinone/menaquinone biosynthesis C-methylase UbiE